MGQAAEQLTDENRDYLLSVKQDREFNNKQIAELTSYELETVRCWFAPLDSTKYRRVPDRAVELLKFKLGIDD